VRHWLISGLSPEQFFFATGYNEQVFFPKPWKKFGTNLCCRF